MAPATFLPNITFLQYSTIPVPDSSKTYPKYLNSDTYSNRAPSTWISHSNPSSKPNTITLLLPALNFRSLSLTQHNKMPYHHLRSSSYSPHKTKSSAYKRPGNLHSLLFLQKRPSLPPHPHFHFFHYCTHIHIEEPRGHDITFSHTTVNSETFALTPLYSYSH